MLPPCSTALSSEGDPERPSRCLHLSSPSRRQRCRCEGPCPSSGTRRSLGTRIARRCRIPAGGHRHQAMSLLGLSWLSWCSSCKGEDVPVKIGPKCWFLRKRGLCAFLYQRGLFTCCPVCSPSIGVCCPGQIWDKITPLAELFSLPPLYPYFLCGCTNIWHNTNSVRNGSDKTGITASPHPVTILVSMRIRLPPKGRGTEPRASILAKDMLSPWEMYRLLKGKGGWS